MMNVCMFFSLNLLENRELFGFNIYFSHTNIITKELTQQKTTKNRKGKGANITYIICLEKNIISNGINQNLKKSDK